MFYLLLGVLIANAALLTLSVRWIGVEAVLVYVVIYIVGLVGTSLEWLQRPVVPLWVAISLGITLLTPLAYYGYHLRQRSSDRRGDYKVRFRTFVLLISAIGIAIPLLATGLISTLEPDHRSYMFWGILFSLGVGTATGALLFVGWHFHSDRFRQEGFRRW